MRDALFELKVHMIVDLIFKLCLTYSICLSELY